MDRNTIIGIILIAVILIGYSIITKPQREEMAEQRRVADSIRMAEQAVTKEVEKQQPEESVELPTRSDTTAKTGIFSSAASGEDAFYTIENDKLVLRISKRGGKPYSVQLN